MYTISNDVYLNYIDDSLKEIVEITGKSNEEVLIVLEKFLFNLEQRGHISKIKIKEDKNALKI